MFERTVDSGDYVIRQGDDGDNFYVIDRWDIWRKNWITTGCNDIGNFSGAFHIYVASENEPAQRLVGQYEGSGSFGELALMYNMPRAATVQVRTGSNLKKKDLSLNTYHVSINIFNRPCRMDRCGQWTEPLSEGSSWKRRARNGRCTRRCSKRFPCSELLR